MARASFWVVLLTGLLGVGIAALFHYLRAPQLGQALGVLALLYVLLLLVGGWFGSQHELVDACFFLVPLAALLVLVDVLAVQQLRVLSFPDHGAYRVGPVPIYVAGLRVAPLLVVVWLAESARQAAGAVALPVAVVTAAAAFAAAEWAGVALALWLPRNVWTWHGIAPYAVVAETLLGVAAWLMFVQVQERVFVLKIAAAAAVAAFYAGALIASQYAFQRFL